MEVGGIGSTIEVDQLSTAMPRFPYDSTTTGSLLLEAVDYLLLETGDKLLLE